MVDMIVQNSSNGSIHSNRKVYDLTVIIRVILLCQYCIIIISRDHQLSLYTIELFIAAYHPKVEKIIHLHKTTRYN